MLSRKATCLWILLALPLVALVASGVSLGQHEPIIFSPPSAPDSPEVPVTPDSQVEVLEFYTADAPRTTSPVPRSATEAAVLELKKAQARLQKAQAQFQKDLARFRKDLPEEEALGISDGLHFLMRHATRDGRRHEPARRQLDPEEMANLLKEDVTLEREARNRAKQCRNETDKQKQAKMKTKLLELTAKHFELRQERRRWQIARLEAELEKVRATIDKRNDAREVIIRRRVSKLLGERDELGWGPPAAVRRAPRVGVPGVAPYSPANTQYPGMGVAVPEEPGLPLPLVPGPPRVRLPGLPTAPAPDAGVRDDGAPPISYPRSR